MARKLSKAQLTTLLKWWQELLGIAHWKIKLKMKFVAGYPDTSGYSSVDSAYLKHATIELDPREPDLERVIVHELVHVVTDDLVPSGTDERIEEPPIWALSDALYALKRKAYGEEESTHEA